MAQIKIDMIEIYLCFVVISYLIATTWYFCE